MSILAKKNKLTILRYLSQGSRIIFAFVLVIYAKKQGTLTNYGRLLNVSAIYAMLSSSALLPFLNQLWSSFNFYSIFKKIFIYFGIIGIVIFIVAFSFLELHNLIIISLGGFVFVTTNILIQYSQIHKSLHFIVPTTILFINIFFIGFAYIFPDIELITIYFLPYIVIIFFFFFFFKKINFSKYPDCNWINFYSFLNKIYGWSLLLSLCWPITFLVIREMGSAKDLTSWENSEFFIRLSMSVLGLASNLIINYNLHSSNLILTKCTKNLLLNNLIPAYGLLILGYIFIYWWIDEFYLIWLIVFFFNYLFKIGLLSFAYPLLALDKVRSIAIVELLSSGLIILFFKVGLHIAFSLFCSTIFSATIVVLIWLKSVNYKEELKNLKLRK